MQATKIRSSALVVLVLLAFAGCSGYGDAESAEGQLKFGVQMAQRQLWNEALFRFRQAAELDPANPRVYNNLAVASEAAGEFEQALEYYRKALEMSPSDRVLRANYTRFVEFYQRYKPPQEGEEGGEGGEGEEGAGSPRQETSGGAS